MRIMIRHEDAMFIYIYTLPKRDYLYVLIYFTNTELLIVPRIRFLYIIYPGHVKFRSRFSVAIV